MSLFVLEGQRLSTKENSGNEEPSVFFSSAKALSCCSWLRNPVLGWPAWPNWLTAHPGPSASPCTEWTILRWISKSQGLPGGHQRCLSTPDFPARHAQFSARRQWSWRDTWYACMQSRLCAACQIRSTGAVSLRGCRASCVSIGQKSPSSSLWLASHSAENRRDGQIIRLNNRMPNAPLRTSYEDA